MSAPDPVEAHVAALSAALHGPARLKDRMLAEFRDGLMDAAADLSPDGPPDARAARQAVVEFGTVLELSPAFQRELTIAQARRTARTTALLIPLLLAAWCLAGTPGASSPLPLQLAAANAGGVAVTAALLAAVFLALTGARRLPTPDRLPLAVAWTGTAAAAAVAVSALALAASSALAANWLLTALTVVLALASHAGIASSARACRHCALLPAPGAGIS